MAPMGCWCPRAIPNGWPRRSLRVLLDDETYADFSAESLARSKYLTIEACADAHLDLYRRLISSGSTAMQRSAPEIRSRVSGRRLTAAALIP